MRAHLLLYAGTVLLAACSANFRTMAHDPAPGDAPNVTVYLSN